MPHVFADEHADAPAVDHKGLDAAALAEVTAFVEHAVRRQIDLAMQEGDVAALEQCGGVVWNCAVAPFYESGKHGRIECLRELGGKRGDGMHVVAQIVAGKRKFRRHQQVRLRIGRGRDNAC